ncbi:MAG TPA: NAD-dependent epimerase/dehydratase family protein [Steroidobacteraceae bacterium]|jgi:nucleoside-diphosphate-sugar epimerase|nr:NAD-dependent epimerase/dehydratase family protein [Steroidobacteraceae bacterium]
MQSATQTALIIGITGSIGREVSGALMRRGWQVRALHRDPAAAAASGTFPDTVHWVKGDAMQLDEVIEAARGTALIVHAANPPKYRNWRGLALPMLDNTIAAARMHGARILLPAPIYNYGANAPRVLKENSPQIPTTRKGQVRVEMELQLQKASLYGVSSIVVRAGDFFGPGAGSSWLTQGMVRGRGRVRTVSYPGEPTVGHAWAYLPDLAETMVRLVECERPMGAYEVFHFRGHWCERGVEMAEAACRALGISTRRIKPFPWWAVKLSSPFVNVCREMLEMRYLWQVPLELHNEKLHALIGPESHTPIEVALAATLRDNIGAGERTPGMAT